MSYVDTGRPTAFDYFRTGLWASAIAYVGILGLVTISLAVGSGSPSSMVSVFIIGGLYMAIPAVGIAVFITAPMGCVIGIIMRKALPPGQWHGAVNGGAVMGLILGLFALYSFSFADQWPDPGTLVFGIGLIAIGAGSGWLAQRTSLNWPVPIDESAADIFA